MRCSIALPPSKFLAWSRAEHRIRRSQRSRRSAGQRRPRRSAQVHSDSSAREEVGFVLMVDGRFVVLSRARTGELGSADAVQRCIDAQVSGKPLINQAAAEFAVCYAAWEALQAYRGEASSGQPSSD
jgi:hypothetical protein